jgi:hypothetical protein
MSKIEVDAIEPQSGTTLTIGASGDTITIPSGATLTNSGTATGFGIVLQVVNAFTETETNSSSGSYADTTLTASITPSSASNKVLVLINQCIGKRNSNNYINLQLLRGATAIGGTDDLSGSVGYTDNASYNYLGTGFSCSFLDSPNTTSSTTYKTQFKRLGAGSESVVCQIDSGSSYITLIEIAG